MHLPSETMLSYMGLAEAGIWAVSVNDGKSLVLVIKLATDTLKWIQRGVEVNLLIGHVRVDDKIIRVVGLEVFDTKTNPLIPSLPQVEDWEVKQFDRLLEKGRFTIHFHNEQPFVSVLDATGSLPPDLIQSYNSKRSAVKVYNAPVPTDTFRNAQDAFVRTVGKKGQEFSDVEIFRFPLTISNPVWNSVQVPDAGTFAADNINEGESHETLLLHVLEPNFDGRVFPSPQISDGNKMRELIDVLAISKNAFLFEAKAFSVFDKSFEQSSERKAATVMKHFQKALGQLEGAMNRLKKGVEIKHNNLPSTFVTSSQFETLHGIVLVSNTNFDLPWLEIGKQLAEAQTPPHICYHLIPLVELQRMVAFAKGSSDQLNSMFKRRSEIVASTKNAHMLMDYRPEVTDVLKLPAVPATSFGFRFVLVGENANQSMLRMFPIVYDQLLKRNFSGRLDFLYKVGKVEGIHAIGIGVGADSISENLTREWWSHLQSELYLSFDAAGLPRAVLKKVRIETMAQITSQYSDLLLAVELENGFVVAKAAGEKI